MSRSSTEGTAGELTVSREIDAPIDLVWRAWLDPDLVRRWWGPKGFTAPIARMDVREGGTSLVCMRSSEGHEIYNLWSYRLVQPLRRLEFDSRFAESDGTPVPPSAIGMPPGVPDPVPHVVTFEDLGDRRTRVTVTEHGYTTGPVLELSRQGQEECVEKLAAAVTAPGP